VVVTSNPEMIGQIEFINSARPLFEEMENWESGNTMSAYYWCQTSHLAYLVKKISLATHRIHNQDVRFHSVDLPKVKSNDLYEGIRPTTSTLWVICTTPHLFNTTRK
jgi:hypothetical protein